MPRNSNGTYSLPSGNPVVGGTYITTAWANPTMEDLAAAITDSLSRSGAGGMQVPFKNVDGSAVSPGITWVNEINTGFYRTAAQDMRVVVGGADKMRFTAAAVQLWDGTAWSNLQTALTVGVSLANYPLKAGTETISGTWIFSNVTRFDNIVTVGGGSGFNLLDAAGTSTFQLYNLTAQGRLLHPTDISAFIGGAAILSLKSTGASVTGALSATGGVSGTTATFTTGSFSGTLTGTALIASPPSGPAQLYLIPVGGSQSQVHYLSPLLFNDGTADRFQIVGADVGIPGNLNVVGSLSKSGTAVALQSRRIDGQFSIQGGGDLSADRGLYLAGDLTTPGSSWYYGTNASGVKGWNPLSSVVGVPEAPVDGVSYARKDASWVSLGSGGVYVVKTGDTMTGSLILNYSTPRFQMLDASQAAGAKLWDVVLAGRQFVIRALSDDSGSADAAITITRGAGSIAITDYTLGSTNTSNGTLHGSVITFSPGATSFTGPHTAPVMAGVVHTGACEIGAYSVDGTNNPRSSLWVNGAAATLGLDYAYATGVTKFQFRRVGTEIFNYNDTGVEIINGLRLNWLGPASASAGNVAMSADHYWVANITNGSGHRLSIGGAAILTTTVSRLTLGTGVGLTVPGTTTLTGVATFAAAPVFSAGLGNISVGTLTASGAATVASINTTGTNTNVFKGTVEIDGGKILALYDSTLTNSTGLYNAGYPFEVMVSSRGALWGWESTTLVRGKIAITTSAPVGNDAAKAGNIVLVYE